MSSTQRPLEVPIRVRVRSLDAPSPPSSVRASNGVHGLQPAVAASFLVIGRGGAPRSLRRRAQASAAPIVPCAPAARRASRVSSPCLRDRHGTREKRSCPRSRPTSSGTAAAVLAFALFERRRPASACAATPASRARPAGKLVGRRVEGISPDGPFWTEAALAGAAATRHGRGGSGERRRRDIAPDVNAVTMRTPGRFDRAHSPLTTLNLTPDGVVGEQALVQHRGHVIHRSRRPIRPARGQRTRCPDRR